MTAEERARWVAEVEERAPFASLDELEDWLFTALHLLREQEQIAYCGDCGTVQDEDQREYDKDCRCGGSFMSPDKAVKRIAKRAEKQAFNEGVEASASFVEKGRFLSDDSPPKRFANEVVPRIRALKREEPR